MLYLFRSVPLSGLSVHITTTGGLATKNIKTTKPTVVITAILAPDTSVYFSLVIGEK